LPLAERLGIDCSRFPGPIIPSHLQRKLNLRNPGAYFRGYQAPDAEQRCHLYLQCDHGSDRSATIGDPIIAAENAITLNNLIKTAK
jgi:hypothetical protein